MSTQMNTETGVNRGSVAFEDMMVSFYSTVVVGIDPSIFYYVTSGRCETRSQSANASSDMQLQVRAAHIPNIKGSEKACVAFTFNASFPSVPPVMAAPGPSAGHIVLSMLGNGGIAVFGPVSN
jgi:hypothetical protein